MRSFTRWLWIAAVAATVWAAPARAEDKLANIVKKQDLTSEDKARIDQEVEDRAKRVVDAADKSPSDREDARNRLLDTLSVSGASDPALNYYADRCAHHLGVLLLSNSRPAAEDAAMVIRAVGRPETAKALITGLRSPFESVQYHCAVGIKNLHQQIGGDRSLASDALQVLGDVGAKTNSEILLRVIYEAIDFAGAIPNFPLSDQEANALTQVMKARLERIELGSQDELKDSAGYKAAFDLGKTKTSVEAKRELLKVLAGMLDAHARRYGNRETYRDYLPTLRRLVEELERAIGALLQSEQTNMPSQTLSDVVKERPNASRAREAMAAVDDLRRVLKQPPWSIE